MEWHFFLLYSTVILLSSFIILSVFQGRESERKPGPRGWPVVGHMFNLGSAPHRTIADLRSRYGPVVWLKLGSVNTMAVLTAKAAAELFKNHDLSFADRTIVDNMTTHSYHNGSLALAPYGPHWRLLRRLCTVEMFVTKRINETAGVRGRCIDQMLSWIEKNGDGIAVGKYVFLAAFNMLGNLTMSRDLVDPESETAMEFYSAMKRTMEWTGSPNVSDFFPSIRWMDLQGLKRKADRDMGIAFGIASGFVKERMKLRVERDESERDFLDVLLESEECDRESGKLSENEIIVFILEMFLAGTETTSSTIEWAMTELLRNPGTMAKAKSEMSDVVGPTEKFQENQIDRLPYLQAVIKETLRLHPPIPFLIPRRAVRDTTFLGYSVPKDTQIFVNVWAIGRDEEIWEDALSFKPERFLGTNTDYRGVHYELIPFGAGRRICAGLPLGHRMLHILLGSLLHGFDWELASPLPVDMNERMGITLGKLHPLKANAKANKKRTQ